MRWWWTAAVSSSDGIGACSASECRSDRTIRRAPSSMAASASAQISSMRAASASPPPATRYRPERVAAFMPGMSPSALMWMSLASSSLSITGKGRVTLRQDAAVGLQQVALRAERGAQRGDQLLADGVQRRVGDLREQLGEVVEEQPRALGERGDRRVGAHGADRLGAGPGHRREDDAQLLLGVAEGLLAAGDRGVGVHDVLALGQVGELDLAGLQPLRVRAARRRGSALISSSSMMRCSAVSTRNIRPGCRRPLRTTLAGSMSRTPTSEPRTTRPSSVTQ